jgi:Mg-chelatase subunit ChlD
MNKIIKPNKISIGGGLHGRIKSQELLKELEPKVDPKQLPNRIAIIADFSGSMGSPDNYKDNPKAKLDLLKEGIQNFALQSDTSNTALAVESFPAGFRIEMTNDTQEVYMRMMSINTLGDTPMGEGLRNTMEYHSPTRCMLVSDGEQTDGDECFKEAEKYRQREVVVDCFHIGSSKRGEDTLKRIAEITGGMYFKFTDVQSFSDNLIHLLPGQREVLAQLPESTRASLMNADDVK